MQSPRRIYSFYGCGLESEMPLAHVAQAGDPASAEATLILGEVPEELPDPLWSSPFVSVSANGSVLIRVEAIGRFLVQGGRSITAQPNPSANSVEIEALVVGSVAGALLHQRAVLPLHASCVALNGAAVALTGGVASGKSTLAAALVRRGGTLMSDDICAVRFRDEGAPVASAGSVGLRLWPDAKEALAGDAAAWSPVRPGHAKWVGPFGAQNGLADVQECRLKAAIRLVPGSIEAPEIARLHGPAAVSPMRDLIYRLRVGRALGRGEGLFRETMRLGDTVPVFQLRRPHGLAQLEDAADAILAAMEGRLE